MTYNPSIPLSTDLISASQQPIEDNFTELNNQFLIDHTAFNVGGVNGDGHHKQVTFNVDIADPPAAGTVSVIYPKLVGGVQSPYFINAVGATALWRGGANSGLITQTTGGNTSNGSMEFPNGVGFKWGTFAVPIGPTAVVFPVAFPTACFSVTVSPVIAGATSTNLNIQPATLAAAGFSVFSNVAVTFTYFAIGN